MAIISFAYRTADAFCDGKKTVTRRWWSAHHMEMWQRQWDNKRVDHDAWDKLPHAGGKKIGRFRLTCRPYWERLCDMPEEDLELEGNVAETLEEFWHLVGGDPYEEMCVVRFYKLEDE